jgi:hypothetical protein
MTNVLGFIVFNYRDYVFVIINQAFCFGNYTISHLKLVCCKIKQHIIVLLTSYMFFHELLFKESKNVCYYRKAYMDYIVQ